MRINDEHGVLFETKENYSAIWINKGFHFHSDIFEELDDKLRFFLKEEIKEYRKNILFALSTLNLPVIGRNPFEYIDVSKFRVLIKAVDVGLKIPSTCYAHSLTDAKEFIEFHKKVVIKPMTNIAFFESKDSRRQYSMYTKILKINEIEKENIDFNFPSLIQEHINANLEIRVFCLDNFFWSGAIPNEFAYVDGSECDYRSNSSQRRIIPFDLPKPIRLKLWRLMDSLGLNVASIDLILNDKGEYYFLEINPVGQFEFLSSICNYKIEAFISDWIIKSLKHEEIR
ncbi:MAG: hypothetical protein IPN20_20205 [Haliscomenobacter sp.]|nr:hypothetical protein [Haliscomenobacter sp.]